MCTLVRPSVFTSSTMNILEVVSITWYRRQTCWWLRFFMASISTFTLGRSSCGEAQEEENGHRCCNIDARLRQSILKKERTVETSVGKLTPSSFLSMILMATFSPVRRCRPSFTLAKPPGEKNGMQKSTNQQQVVDMAGHHKNTF